MPYTLQVGSYCCHILNDGRHLVDGGGFFGLVPRVLWQRVIAPNDLNQIPTDNRSLLIDTGARLILVDTGYGDKFDAKRRQILGIGSRSRRLVAELALVGHRPEEIDIVLLTHLHGDHVGGATRWPSDDTPGPLQITFPNARHIVQRLEMVAASHPNERTAATYLAENWSPLLTNRQLDVVDGDRQIAPGVSTEVMPGHTAGIQVVWVESEGETLLFLTDACSWAVHLDRLAWVPSFDIYPQTSIETKRRLRRLALERNALLVFQHDSQTVTGRLQVESRGPMVEPEITKAAWEE